MGAIVDVQFNDKIPNLLNALYCELNGKKLILEVAQHIGDGIVRTIAMDSTNGLARGVDVIDTDKQIEAPVGRFDSRQNI
jgi:F-type H+-transporting ATPase subunit beta